MSPPLSHEEHLEVLACIHELHRCRSLRAFPEHALAALARLIPSNLTAFDEVNRARGRILSVTDRGTESRAEEHHDQHPLRQYTAETGDGQAMKLSDFLSEEEYHRLDLYRDVYRTMHAEDQLSITMRSDAGVSLGVAFNRDRRDFTERERVKLNLVRPHVLLAYANAEELTGHRAEKDDLRTALRETGHGLIGLDATGHILHATPGAPECLARFLPDVEPARGVPAPIAEWLASDAHTPFVLHAADAKLIVRSPRQTQRRLLVLSEERRHRLPGAERLTPRETEVLRWISEGKSNAEIGVILGIAAGTVKQHVQRILTKLGVENRTTAAMVAREHGLIANPS